MAKKTYTEFATHYQVALNNKENYPPQVKAALTAIGRITGTYDEIDPKGFTTSFQTACLELTSLHPAELLGEDYVSGLDPNKLKVAAVLLKTLLIYSKVFEYNMAEDSINRFATVLGNIKEVYYAHIPFLFNGPSIKTYMGQYRKILGRKGAKLFFLQGQILGRLIYETTISPKSITDAQTRTFVASLKDAYTQQNATTNLILAAPKFTLKNATRLTNLIAELERTVNEAKLLNATDPLQAAQKSSAYHALLNQIEEINKINELSKSEKIAQIVHLIDGSELSTLEKQLVQVVAAKDSILFEGQSPLAKALLLNDEQEQALTSNKAVTYITAGAGSGKTRVLAGRVAHFLNQNDVTPFNIIATSFSKKSANELRTRVRALASEVEKGTDEIQNVESTLIGRTVHSVAREMLAMFKPSALKKKVIEDYDQFTIIEQAIELISGDSEDGTKSPTVNAPKEGYLLQTSNEFSGIPEQNRVISLLALNLYNIANFVINVKRVRSQQWANDDFATFEPLVRNNTIFDPSSWSKDVKDLFASRFIGSAPPARASKLLKRFGVSLIKNKKGEIVVQEIRSKKASDEGAPLWFKVNAHPEALKEQRVNAKSLGLYITQAKSQYLSPYACAEREKLNTGTSNISLFVAGYGAYQHLLREENLMDHDDTLIEAVSALTDSAALAKVKTRIKHILVDEAQDLNNVQRDLFGLILGTHEIDPSTKLPKKSKEAPQSKSITYIGDPKQTIYGFRGARETEFVNNALEASYAENNESSLITLGQNYRSGKNIVNAANTLLTNMLSGEKITQLGGLCYVGLEAEEGDIKLKRANTVADATKDFANEILNARETAGFTYNQFGVACRTNKEVIPYALALFQKGIPYRTGVDPFQHKSCKIILNAMNLANQDNLQCFKAMKATAKLLGYNSIANRSYDVFSGLQETGDTTTRKPKSERKYESFYDKLLAEYSEGSPEHTFITRCKNLRVAATNMTLGDFYNVVMGYDKLDFAPLSTSNRPIHIYAYAQTGTAIEEEDTTDEENVQEEASNQNDSNDGAEDGNSTEDKEFERATSNPVKILDLIFREGMPDDPEYASVKESSCTAQLDFILKKINKIRADAKRSLDSFTQKELKGMVTLDTVHGWKGLECDNLYVPMLPTWPSDKVNKATDLLMPPDDDGNRVNDDKRKAAALEEETRLAYVALTRGKKSVKVVTYQNKEVLSKDGLVITKPLSKDGNDSVFISKLGLCEDTTNETTTSSTTDTQSTSSRTASEQDIPDEIWQEMIDLGVIEGGGF
jgi:superfamily I DNA/RNA helicase